MAEIGVLKSFSNSPTNRLLVGGLKDIKDREQAEECLE